MKYTLYASPCLAHHSPPGRGFFPARLWPKNLLQVGKKSILNCLDIPIQCDYITQESLRSFTLYLINKIQDGQDSAIRSPVDYPMR